MKYIITKNKIKQTIESFIKNYPDVVSVNFKPHSVWLASDDRSHERTMITVVLDPRKTFEGNTKSEFISSSNKLKWEIWRDVNTYFGLGFEMYGSDWDIEFFEVVLIKI
jgi:hypothetical protein